MTTPPPEVCQWPVPPCSNRAWADGWCSRHRPEGQPNGLRDSDDGLLAQRVALRATPDPAEPGEDGTPFVVRIRSGNCAAGDHGDCLGMVEQDTPTLGVTDCLCQCHATPDPAEPDEHTPLSDHDPSCPMFEHPNDKIAPGCTCVASDRAASTVEPGLDVERLARDPNRTADLLQSALDWVEHGDFAAAAHAIARLAHPKDPA